MRALLLLVVCVCGACHEPARARVETIPPSSAPPPSEAEQQGEPDPSSEASAQGEWNREARRAPVSPERCESDDECSPLLAHCDRGGKALCVRPWVPGPDGVAVHETGMCQVTCAAAQ